MSGFLAVMNAAPGDIEKLNNAINNCDGTAERMAQTMQDNLAGQLTILKSQLEELAISIGEILMPSIRQIVGWIQGLVDWLNGLDEGTKKVIVTVALLAAALGPVLTVVGKVAGAVGTILTVVPGCGECGLGAGEGFFCLCLGGYLFVFHGDHTGGLGGAGFVF